MPVIPAALTRELGVANTETGLTGHPFEETVELVWPNSVRVYDRMRRTDGQTRSLLLAVTYPILGTRWHVAGSAVRPEVLALVESELGLVVDEHGRRRTRRSGVSFDDLLRNALLMLPFGHSPLEQVYSVGPADTPGLAGREIAHLRKLAPRLPWTLSGIDVARDGGLDGIRQIIPDVRRGAREVTIPVDRLVYFCNDREGADWTGTSILRSSYKHWLIKDTLIRIDAMAADRQGMGLPVVTYPEGGSRRQALEIARLARTGEDAGVALPEGWTFSLVGVSGGTTDLLSSIKYHEEAQGRSMLAMFLNLGHDNGARSLGDTFVDYFLMACQAVVRHIEEVVTEHVIADLVRVNFGEDEPYPALIADPLSSESTPTATALKTLVDAELIKPDDVLRTEVRRRYGLPPEAAQEPESPDGTPGDPDAAPPPRVTEPSPATGYVPGTGSPTREEDVLPRTGVRNIVASEAVLDRFGRPVVEGGECMVRRAGAFERGRVIGEQDGGVLVDVEQAGPLVVAAESVAMLAGVTYEGETEQIRERRGTTEARRSHPFRPAVWSHPNGHPRCALCGGSQRGDTCPGSDRDGLVTTQPGARGVTRPPQSNTYARDDSRRAGDASYAEESVSDVLGRVERIAAGLAVLSGRVESHDVAFHLPGKHDQRSHAKGGSLGVSMTRESGGATINPRTGQPVTSGVAVASGAPSGTMDREAFFADEDAAVAEISDYVQANASFLDNGDTHLGLWDDADSGKVVFDIVEITDRDNAIRLGRERNEKAVFDLDTFETVDTGGTGRYSQGVIESAKASARHRR